LRSLACLNILLTLAMENESPQEWAMSAALCYPQSGHRRCLACPGARCRCSRCGWFSLCDPWLSVDPATYLSSLSCWNVTPLCLCTVVLPIWLAYGGNNYTFVFNHIPSHLAVVKYGYSRFQFCTNSAIYRWFLV
jgi:hypothetical protein